MSHFLTSLVASSALLAGLTFSVSAKSDFRPNLDEAAVPAYTLPELMVFEDGSKVAAVADWPARRAEILGLFKRKCLWPHASRAS